MTDAEKVQITMGLISDMSISEQDAKTYLTIAADRILNRVYPFGSMPSVLPDRYAMTQIQLAVRMIARIGGEGEISHSENGVSRSYDSVDDEDIMRTLTPYVGVV